jgi:hypothetical protein
MITVFGNWQNEKVGTVLSLGLKPKLPECSNRVLLTESEYLMR